MRQVFVADDSNEGGKEAQMTLLEQVRQLRADMPLRTKVEGLLALDLAALEAALVDAERYRWLQAHCDSMAVEPPLTVAKVAGWGLEAWSGDDLSASIDEARNK